ncbi:alpha/beta hydrolase [Rubellimicrobium roseum]|uniref:Alpha/beta hydrolase n=1 Tax=Rubellimicrobium roseum TaxID=687525 RepID=A0A5C4N7R7_9RHOB|nr:alpha/beta hydrolase [Rubellimicrobium roseum]TNC64901.1 alpha/beta hydrolase [Rubellimicrobium roseum]
MDRQDPYRIRDYVPDFDAIAAEFASRSEAVTQRATLRTDIAYGPGPRETLDLIFPDRVSPDAPLHLFVHGGYWRSGEKANYRLVAEPVLKAGGIAALVEYDLLPGARLATLVGQVRRAALWLQENALGFGADSGRFTVSGHSAGAHLASYLAAKGPQESQPRLPEVAGLLLVSGIYDLSEIPDSFLKEEAGMTPEEAAAWTPITSAQLPGPRRTLVVGAEETRPFHDHGQQLSDLLKSQGLDANLRVEPGLDHMSIVLALADPDHPLGRHFADMVAGLNGCSP